MGKAELGAAVAIHRKGDIDAAEAFYRRILDSEPDNAEALHLLGVIALQRGDAAGSQNLIARALLHEPGRGEFHRTWAWRRWLRIGWPRPPKA